MVDAAFLINLAMQFGYLGVFLASLIGSASVFVPLPSFLIVAAAGTFLNPFAVGVVAGLGAAIGELVGYAIGVGIIYTKKKIQKKEKLTKKDRGYVKTIKDLFQKKYGPIIIFIFAATPLPDKIIGAVCGAIKYDIKKFFIATLLGKIILHVIIAYAGLYGIHLLESFF